MDPLQKKIGEIWSEKYQRDSCKERIRWSRSQTVIQHITRLLCGEPQSSIQAAIFNTLHNIAPTLPFERGISVACGTGAKELGLIEKGIVKSFDLFELSQYSIDLGKEEAQRRGLADSVFFHLGDALNKVTDAASYDFVYWDNALHHMLDANAAIAWSKHILKNDGLFFMYDFVGPTRFQWSEEQIRIVREILEGLDDSLFLIPGTEYMWKKEPNMLSEEEIIQKDPSEAADSGNILPAFRKHFPEGTVIPLGGLIYVLGLDGIIVNIPENSILLKKLLTIDFLLSKDSHNYYAVAYAVKQGPSS